jgi:hypothetical protein
MRELLALRQEEAALLGYANFGEVSLVPKMADSPAQVIALRDLAGKARPLPKAMPTCAPSRPAVGWPTRRPGTGLRRRKAQGSALRLQRAGGQAVLPAAQGAGGPVQDRRDPVRGQHPRHASVWHPSVRVLPHRARRASWWASSTSTRWRAPASAAAPGWTTRARWLRPDTGSCRPRGLPGLQLRHRGGRQAAAADARRRDHPVPRVRPRPAPHADAGGERGVSGITASNGTRSSCPASSWKTSAGNGTCCAT